ncbi:WbqC family protein [Candidatus Woesearchaeota archaeon]|jgi:hypothetical protein|nr:WbqC family protein [Candidatus Woesearchaeota archaeon]
MTIISIRQPGYLPHAGFFKKIQSTDIFVILDDVQYERGDWDNRNKIKMYNGTQWLTVPIHNKFGSMLNEVKIDNTHNWSKKHKSVIKFNYQKSQFFEDYWNDVENILDKKWEKLIDLNCTLIDYFILKLNIKTKIIYSSEFKIKKSGSEKLLEICKNLNASEYLSGELGINYLKKEIFDDANIKVIFERFEHPTYNQIHGKFIPNMSIIDLLFNEGGKAKKILEKSQNY